MELSEAGDGHEGDFTRRVSTLEQNALVGERV